MAKDSGSKPVLSNFEISTKASIASLAEEIWEFAPSPSTILDRWIRKLTRGVLASGSFLQEGKRSMVDSVSTLSSLELTRNPFDSSQERVNCPGFSPSMFRKQETPSSQKKTKAFRWSIEQISRLNPADIDEFPHQEYSSTFDREEDEIQVQKAIDEYFSQSSIVPSPWTPTYSAKHVKFSPLPPATAYIEAISSTESSYSSPNSSGCKAKADVSTQTKLSFPPYFDLQSLIDQSYYNQDGLNGSRDISLTTLRRKLFDQAGIETGTDQCKLDPPTNIKSILKSPKSPILITSSPVSERSTPMYSKHRSSTTSTISSPNMSPIKPMLSVLETPSRKRLSVSRQTLSPMECSTNGFNSSGIEVMGDALPDISPIKMDRGDNFAQKMDIFNDAEDVENANNSVDDGGPLEVSALSTEDNFSHHDAKEKEESDNEMAPGITMEDLASDVDFMRDDSGDKGSNSSKVKIEVSSPKENSVDEKPFQSVVDGSIRTRMSAEHFKAPKEIRTDGEDIDSNHNHRKFSGVIEDKQSKLGKETFGNSHDQAIRKAWQTSDYRSIGSPMKDCHFCELDEDIIVMRARAALRRANRHSSMDNSLSLSDLSLNRSSAWEPIRMSTPLVPQDSLEYTNNQYYADGDGNLGYSSASRSHDHFDAFFGRESWHRERGQDMTSHHYHHSISTKPVSAVEDIIRQRKVQKKLEGKYGLSSSWRKSSSPLYESKWRLSRTHPMSHLEWKALYWRPPSQPNHWRDKHWYSTDPFEADLARLSGPPRPVSSKLIHGSRRLSPPVNFPPAKVPRAVFTGYVSKMPIPYYQDSSDSGYSDWQQSTGQWEGTMRGHHSLLGTPRAGIRYY